jgi:hypothetical protein
MTGAAVGVLQWAALLLPPGGSAVVVAAALSIGEPRVVRCLPFLVSHCSWPWPPASHRGRVRLAPGRAGSPDIHRQRSRLGVRIVVATSERRDQPPVRDPARLGDRSRLMAGRGTTLGLTAPPDRTGCVWRDTSVRQQEARP